MSETKKNNLVLLIAALIGCAIMVVPVALDSEVRRYEAEIFPIMRTAVEGMKIYSIPVLGLFGIFLGFAFHKPAWLLGLTTMAAFPVWSLIDAILGGSHNLLPIEWIIYFLTALVAVVGAVIGRFLRGRVGVK